MSGYTPTPWEVKDIAGAGWEIRATLPKGFKFDGTDYGADGKTSFQTWILTEPRTILIGAERWVQFETEQWRAMQKANAELICKAVNNHEALVKALRDLTESYCSAMHGEWDMPEHRGGRWTEDEVAKNAKAILDQIE